MTITSHPPVRLLLLVAVWTLSCDLLIPYNVRQRTDTASPTEDGRPPDLQDAHLPEMAPRDVGREDAVQPLVDASQDGSTPEPDVAADVTITADASLVDAPVTADAGSGSSCLTDETLWFLPQCPVTYLCCRNCVDSVGKYSIQCHLTGECTCRLNLGANVICNQKDDCDKVITSNCCSKAP